MIGRIINGTSLVAQTAVPRAIKPRTSSSRCRAKRNEEGRSDGFEAVPTVLLQVLNGCRQTHPTVHPLLLHRNRRLGKRGFGEDTDRYGYYARHFIEGVVIRGRTGSAEAESGVRAFVADAGVHADLAADRNMLSREPCLSTEVAAGSALAGKAMTDGESAGLARHGCRELPA